MSSSLLLLVWLLGPVRAAPAPERVLIPFALKDQFDATHSAADLAGRIVVMVGSDREGSPYNRVWSRTLVDSLKGEAGFTDLRFLPVADTRGAPFFLKELIRRTFRKKVPTWVLRDWTGKLADAYRFEPEMSNIAVFDRAGALRHRSHGRELESERLSAVLGLLRRLMAAEP